MGSRYDNIIVAGKSGAGKQPRIDVLVRQLGFRQLSTGNIFRTYLKKFNNLNHPGDIHRFYDPASRYFVANESIVEALGIHSHPDLKGIILGLKAKYFVEQGLYVPDTITNALFDSAFRDMGYRNVVLDGFPRTLEQARFLVDLVKRKGVKLDAVLMVENEDNIIIERTMGRRICNTCGEVFHVQYRQPPTNMNCGRPNAVCDIVQRSDDTLESLKVRLNEFHTKTRPAIDFLIQSGIPLHTVPGNLPDYSPESVKASVCQVLDIA
jgi:adenylate kinase